MVKVSTEGCVSRGRNGFPAGSSHGLQPESAKQVEERFTGGNLIYKRQASLFCRLMSRAELLKALHILTFDHLFSPINTFTNMRGFPTFLTIAGLMAIGVFANPTLDPLATENMEKRGCNTGNWCCTIANPSTYCIKYCAGGSRYLDCGKSYVSQIVYAGILQLLTAILAVSREWTMRMHLSLLGEWHMELMALRWWGTQYM